MFCPRTYREYIILDYRLLAPVDIGRFPKKHKSWYLAKNARCWCWCHD